MAPLVRVSIKICPGVWAVESCKHQKTKLKTIHPSEHVEGMGARNGRRNTLTDHDEILRLVTSMTLSRIPILVRIGKSKGRILPFFPLSFVVPIRTLSLGLYRASVL